ncbi:MAG: M14 family metallopeptidase [Planctomycetota bacterium]|nr:M14 family metallopeptidase [Planctomycetota bacterium]
MTSPVTTTVTTTGLFAATYAQARDGFRRAVTEAGGTLEALTVSPDGCPAGGPLTIDVGVVTGPEAESDGPILLLTSGLHGVEGFAGSALQRLALTLSLPRTLRLVMLHALNPFGMAHGRRTNESNVDLNRNFLAPGETYFQPAQAYRPFHPLLNPTSPRPPLGLDFFLPRALLAISRHGMAALKQSIVGGQYEFPRGIFFGGHDRQREVELIEQALPRLCPGSGPITHLDFHTGLGPSGSHALLLEAAADSPRLAQIRAAWGPRVQPWDSGRSVAYRIRGGFPAAATRLFGPRATTLTCEFGTYAPIRVLAGLRRENRNTNWNAPPRELEASRRALTRLFNPPRPTWRAAILAGGEEVLERASELARAHPS